MLEAMTLPKKRMNLATRMMFRLVLLDAWAFRMSRLSSSRIGLFRIMIFFQYTNALRLPCSIIFQSSSGKSFKRMTVSVYISRIAIYHSHVSLVAS